MVLALLSEANPNGLFRWVPLLRSSGNKVTWAKETWGNTGCFTTGCHA